MREHDVLAYGAKPQSGAKNDGHEHSSCLQNLSEFVNLHLLNGFESVFELHAHLDSLDISNPEYVRPGWDAYFMVCFMS